MNNESVNIAVLIPCYNEETTIEKVVNDFRRVLPTSIIYVYDNNSTDDTILRAKRAGAITRTVKLQGKGHVVRRMFADIEADIYIMVDGDDTYDSDAAPKLIEELQSKHLEMVNGCRKTEIKEAYRYGHRFGNRLLTTIVARIFGNHFSDMLSGYRAFSARFVKTFPALSAGFEIETELTVHALEMSMPVEEVEIRYKDRPVDSYSKLRTYTDGARILKAIFYLIKEERPLKFFTVIGLLLFCIAIVLIVPIIQTYFATGLVPRFPTAILATGLTILGFLSIAAGLILDTVTHGRKEFKYLNYLNFRKHNIDHVEK